MRKLFTALTLVLLPLAGPGRAAPPGALADIFRSEDGGYSVRFPAAPAQSVKNKNGVRLHMDGAAAPGGAATYLVSWGDYFPEVWRAAERVFDDEIRGLVRAGARIAEQKAENVAGVNGRAFRGLMADGKALHGRVFLRDTRFFMLLVAAPEATAGDAAQAFFGTFGFHGPGIPDPPTPPAASRSLRLEYRSSCTANPIAPSFPAARALESSSPPARGAASGSRSPRTGRPRRRRSATARLSSTGS